MFQRLVSRTIAIAALTLAGAVTAAALDAVEYRALIEKNKLQVGERVQFVVVVNYGVGTMAPTITPPTFDKFQVLNESQAAKQQGEGQDQYMTLKHFWLLQPTEPGRLTIASAIITYQDPTTNLLRNGKTDVVFADVAPSDEATPVPAASAPAGEAEAKPAAAGKPFPVVPVAGGAAAVVLLIVLVMFAGRSKEPKVNHEANALDELQRALGHVEQGDLSAYYAALSRALLDYLQNKFGLDAHVLATNVLLERLAKFGIRKEIIASLEDFFKVADKAKFAGYLPDEDEMIKLHGTVKNFIEAGRSIKIKTAKPKPKKQDDDE